MAPPLPLQTGLSNALQNALADAISFLPQLIGALVVLVVGWVVGRLLGGLVRRTVDRLNVDSRVYETPVGRLLGGSEHAVSRSLGKATAWFVYAVTILAAANVLAIDTLSAWLATAVSYLPAFIAGALVILIGFVLADFLADVIARTETVTDTGYTDVFADGVRAFLYFVVLVIGLDTMGVDVAILYVFAQAAAYGLAAGVAIAIGVAFGWGGKDYVHDNIAGWVNSRSEMRSSARQSGAAPGDDS